MKRTAGEVLEIPLANIFLKRRQRQRGPSQYERVAEEGRTKIVSEGGLRFEVNLSDYLDTGLFLDHRITRGMVRQAAAGKRLLNLFAYTGSFSVYAAAGGAASTVTVDLSEDHLDWAQRNMALNDLTGPEHEFVRDDALSFLESCPPAAAVRPGGGRSAHLLQQQAAGGIIGTSSGTTPSCSVGSLDLMTPGGVIFFSTNFRRFKLAEEELRGVDDARDQPSDGAARFPQSPHPPLLADGEGYSAGRISMISNLSVPCGTGISTRSPTRFPVSPWASGLVTRILPLS